MVDFKRNTLNTAVSNTLLFAIIVWLISTPALAQEEGESDGLTPHAVSLDIGQKPVIDTTNLPWMDTGLDPDHRAELVLEQLSLDEKLQFVHGAGFFPIPPGSNGGAGYVPGIGRLGIPDLNLADSTVGVTRGATQSRYSTLMPSAIAEAATWDPDIAYEYAALVGRELRAQGYNASLAGGANLAREPRNGRAFEYRGEDPLLTGLLTAQAIRGMQDQRVIGNLKHFALNDQETGRHSGNVLIDYRAARESDLLAFEIAVKEAGPGMVMCAYNLVWDDHACESEELLLRTLKQEWGFRGWVVSDWGATHSTDKAILAGLDQEQPGSRHFGATLKKAIQDGRVPQAVLDDSVRRILRTMFAIGVVDHPPKRHIVDVQAGMELALKVEEQGAVLLQNNESLLPIDPSVGTIAVIGGNADVGVLTGGGSGQVDPPGGNAVKSERTETLITPEAIIFPKIWWPSSPLDALRAEAPGIRFTFDDGEDHSKAAELAAQSDMAIVFAYSPSSEHSDVPTLSLPHDQDALINAVSSANARTVVVLETSGAVTMPWADKAGAIVAAWFPGAAGGEAIANLLLGKVNFSGKLPITFPRSEADLPHPVIQGTEAPMVPDKNSILPELNIKIKAPFDIHYDEGALVGYKWFDAKNRTPLFAFGHGLSYTQFEYSDLIVTPDDATFTVSNVGERPGTEIAQVYVSLPSNVRLAPRQLAGWAKITLEPSESKTLTVEYHPLVISVFDPESRAWKRPPGKHEIYVGGSTADTPLVGGFSR